MHDLVMAITGASGSQYAIRLLDVLLASGYRVHLTASGAASQVFLQEIGLEFDPAGDSDSIQRLMQAVRGQQRSLLVNASESKVGKLFYYHPVDFSAGIASGSFLTGGMVICPCSMGTLANLASGHSSNLIQRAADVHLKERRKLIVVPRETPLGVIQLENMQRLAASGAVILPAMPGFYHNPESIDDLIDFVVGRICDQLGVEHTLHRRWGNSEG